jgi:nucleoside phosphorylase
LSRKHEYDVGLVIPLKEEFSFVHEIAPIIGRHSYDGTFLYELKFGSLTTIACIIGEMGPLPASIATNRLLSFARVNFLTVLGLAGALDKDVLLGDVVIADEVNEFLAKSKAVESADGYKLRFSGRHSRLDYSLREAISHFEVSAATYYTQWQDGGAGELESITTAVDSRLAASRPRLHIGSIASGDVVGAAKAFTDELLAIDRKFLALDMEAAGVVKAATDRLEPVPVIIVRGISDFADERKQLLDAQGGGAWRRLAVRNAASLLSVLVSWADFRHCTHIGASHGVEALTPANLVSLLERQVGAAWLVGVLFQLHTYARNRSQVGIGFRQN